MENNLFFPECLPENSYCPDNLSVNNAYTELINLLSIWTDEDEVLLCKTIDKTKGILRSIESNNSPSVLARIDDIRKEHLQNAINVFRNPKKEWTAIETYYVSVVTICEGYAFHTKALELLQKKLDEIRAWEDEYYPCNVCGKKTNVEISYLDIGVGRGLKEPAPGNSFCSEECFQKYMNDTDLQL